MEANDNVALSAGRLATMELELVMKSLGDRPTAEQLEQLIDRFDAENSGPVRCVHVAPSVLSFGKRRLCMLSHDGKVLSDEANVEM